MKVRCLSLSIYKNLFVLNMKLVKSLLFVVTISMLLLLLNSCTGNKQSQEKSEPMFNSADTTLVNQLTETFMNELQNGQLDSAVSRLYNIGPDQLEVISEEEQNQLKEYFSAFPVLRYKLKSTEWKNVYEVSYLYSFEFFEKPEGEEAMPNTMNLTLKPTKLSDQWFLTLEKK